MNKVADSLGRGLKQSVAYAKGRVNKQVYQVHIPTQIDVKAIRKSLNLTQEEFAARFGFSVNTLRHWERGSRRPEGPTRAYLMVIEQNPKAVEKALRAA